MKRGHAYIKGGTPWVLLLSGGVDPRSVASLNGVDRRRGFQVILIESSVSEAHQQLVLTNLVADKWGSTGVCRDADTLKDIAHAEEGRDISDRADATKSIYSMKTTHISNSQVVFASLDGFHTGTLQRGRKKFDVGFLVVTDLVKTIANPWRVSGGLKVVR